ncbi:acetoacetate decarboxylase [Streptantibioticus cattleyicolor]|uniref:Acetoacetate decarboxylase n=1 Tax=Streptantibioticus cattleyicolor (strain ATCC 35852 / DSM 46488 / JCM 4925 / NBRC 14057 / NRRL 8057) TaxID=1003195 RepID=F8JJY0_STREN|nr:acetoacetate decarboxylase [Streptantibioticus cattleyicolor]AEW98588.1 acetoacetate decarboxylase [Streptantibioticus cattleyicolor NRRL 8057 = DSM 46488]CCB72352.1 putative acetoacetate decarboxylase [Streptantibioticus cattleyicolor NRRL 8057 = DSM 46488]
MRLDQVPRHASTPLTVPVYPPRPTRFTDREYLNVVYRTDPDALRAVVPEPLEVTEPLVRFEVMRMGEVDGYGPYVEAGQVIPVRYGAEEGEYLHATYLDSFAATAAGRELSAYPKVMASPRLHTEAGALVGTLDFGSERVATATMPYKWQPLDSRTARGQITVPTYAVKIVPDYTGGLRVCDLVRTRIEDVTVKEAWTGPARLQLFAHVMAPLADLPVLEVVSASHIVTDLTLAPALPVYDYLTRTPSR